MSLIFHDRSESPSPQGVPFLTIERGGNFSLSAAAVEVLKLKADQPIMLVQDSETNAWYLYLSTHPGSQPFLLRNKDVAKKSKALTFNSTAKARAYYEANKLDPKTKASVRLLVAPKPVQVAGVSLIALTQEDQPSPAKDAEPAPKKAAPELNPEAEILARIQRQVRELGGLDLHKVADATKTRALGLLTQYPDLLPTIPGAQRLLDKLQAHFSPVQ